MFSGDRLFQQRKQKNRCRRAGMHLGYSCTSKEGCMWMRGRKQEITKRGRGLGWQVTGPGLAPGRTSWPPRGLWFCQGNEMQSHSGRMVLSNLPFYMDSVVSVLIGFSIARAGERRWLREQNFCLSVTLFCPWRWNTFSSTPPPVLLSFKLSCTALSNLLISWGKETPHSFTLKYKWCVSCPVRWDCSLNKKSSDWRIW